MPKVSRGHTKTAVVGLLRSVLSEKSAVITLEGFRSGHHVMVKLQNYRVQGHERLQKQNLRNFLLILVEICLKCREQRWVLFWFFFCLFVRWAFSFDFFKCKFYSLFKNNLRDACKTGC